jgi:hypothetical protein
VGTRSRDDDADRRLASARRHRRHDSHSRSLRSSRGGA